MSKKKYVIWSNADLNVNEEWIDAYKEHLEINDRKIPKEIFDDDVYEFMYDTNSDYLDDERSNLNIQLTRPIIVIGDLGLWNGRRMGYKEISSGNIRDCLYSECDYNTWYIDKQGDLCCEAIHHDGTNFYTYRAIRTDATEAQIENLKDKLYHGTATRSDITRSTVRLGDEIGKAYGWEISGRKPAEKSCAR
ncbi:MAG: hypothetical protein PHY15_00950 [Eubacteriales bacterium]|nr:hypothetical protein [Eubacteriales bacterium]MDD4474376.1 hypothetical protein [Eubacteriales bacterium]